MPRITTGYGVRRAGDERNAFIIVERVPWRIAIIAGVAELLCKLTRHYFCMALSGDIYEWQDRHTETFKTPCTPEHAAALSEWMGWGLPFFMNDDGTQRAYPVEDEGGRFERMP